MGESTDPEIAAAIQGVLDGNAALAALLSAPHAIFQDYAPENSELPYVIFTLHTGTRTERGMHGSHIRDQLWLVKGICRGKSAAPARQIDFRCEQLLDETEFAVASGRVLNLRREQDISLSQPDSGETIYQRGGLYRFRSEP